MLKLSALVPFAVPAIAQAATNKLPLNHGSNLVIITGSRGVGKTSMARAILESKPKPKLRLPGEALLIDIESIGPGRLATFAMGRHGSKATGFPLIDLADMVLRWTKQGHSILFVVPHEIVCPAGGGLSTSIPSVVEAARFVIDVIIGGTSPGGISHRSWLCQNYGLPHLAGTPHPYLYHAPTGQVTYVTWPDDVTCVTRPDPMA